MRKNNIKSWWKGKGREGREIEEKSSAWERNKRREGREREE